MGDFLLGFLILIGYVFKAYLMFYAPYRVIAWIWHKDECLWDLLFWSLITYISWKW